MKANESEPRRFSRRSAIQGGAATFLGISLPNIKPPTERGLCALWIMVLAGDCRSKAGYEKHQEAIGQTRKAGFEIFDSLHDIYRRSQFLARKVMPLRQARRLERLLITQSAGDLADLGEGLVGLWIETEGA